MTRTPWLLATVAVLGLLAASACAGPGDAPSVRHDTPPTPYKPAKVDVPPRRPTPRLRFDRPMGPVITSTAADSTIQPTASKTPDFQGTHAIVDLPAAQHMRNTVGTDNQGLCVWTSLEVLFSRWCHDPRIVGLQERMTHQRGGGWPSRVSSQFAHDAPGLEYVQVEGGRDQIAKALDLAFRTRRGACGTYGYDPQVYGRRTIAHMIDYAHWDKRLAAVVDNNRPAVWEWMAPGELLNRCVHPHGSGWLVIPGGSPPPPEPR